VCACGTKKFKGSLSSSAGINGGVLLNHVVLQECCQSERQAFIG